MTIPSWITTFKTNFPAWKYIYDDSNNDVTDTVINFYLNIAMNTLPQGAVTFFSQSILGNDILQFAVAHYLTYYDVLNSYGQQAALMQNATSMTADGLTIGYQEVAKLKGDLFPSLTQFFATTAYGRQVNNYLEKMVGSVGGFSV